MAYYKDSPDFENVAYKIKAGVYNPDWNKLAKYENFTLKAMELMAHLFPDYEAKYGSKTKRELRNKWLKLDTFGVYEIQAEIESILNDFSKCEYHAATQMKKTNVDLNDEINKKDKDIAKLSNEMQIIKEQNKNLRTEVIQLKQTVKLKNDELANMEISKRNTIDQIMDKLLKSHK